jgi:hypothetical protein
MNRERPGGRPEELAESAQPDSGSPCDQVEYRGPLRDPTKRPAEEAVRPPPPAWVSSDEAEVAVFSRDTLLEELSALVRIAPDFPHPRMHRFTVDEAEQFRTWTDSLSADELLQEVQKQREEHRHKAEGVGKRRRLTGPVLP